MDEILTRISENLLARVGGPMEFRLLLQPQMVGIARALKDRFGRARF